MAYFRCTACGYGCDHPTVIGAGDCPYCGGDVVFDLRREAPPPPPGLSASGGGERRARRGGWLAGWPPLGRRPA